MLKKIILLSIFFLSGNIFIFSCAGLTIAESNKTVILATTTSVQDTGLLDALVGTFQKKTGYTVNAIAVGTGQALKMGTLGEADILWVHSPEDEKKFVEEGYGANRTTFMHNDFVILGPKNDPAKVINAKNAVEAFKKIAAAKTLFVSRGDNSGTHKKEKAIWKKAGMMPDKGAYIEVGQGMAQTVTIANEKQGYVLADRSTYVSLKKSIDLAIVCEGDPALINYYSLILVNPDKFSKVNADGARALFNFLLSKDSREIIENFGREKFGEQLFFWDLNENP
jgi:tungstate transport system substrate-binding protein